MKTIPSRLIGTASTRQERKSLRDALRHCGGWLDKWPGKKFVDYWSGYPY